MFNGEKLLQTLFSHKCDNCGSWGSVESGAGPDPRSWFCWTLDSHAYSAHDSSSVLRLTRSPFVWSQIFKKKKKKGEKNFVSSWNISNWSMLQIRWRVCSTPRFSPVDLLLLCCAQQAKGKYSVLKYCSCHKAVYLAASAFLTMLNCIRMKCHYICLRHTTPVSTLTIYSGRRS